MNELKKELFELERQAKLKIQFLQSKYATHKCLYPGCCNNAILSHTISRNILEKISENGHVYCAFSNMADIGKNYEDAIKSPHINIKFQKTGINKAGVFKGFCNPHDFGIFENLDKHIMLTQRDLFLQLYRTTCKFFFRDKTLIQGEREIYGFEVNSNSKFEESLEIKLQDLVNYLQDMLVDFPELDTKIPTSLEESFLITPFNKNFNTNFCIIYKKLPAYYNFALENNLILKVQESIHHCIIVLVPGKLYSNLIILCHDSIKNLFLSKISKEISLLNFLESIFILDSEFYLPPSIVDNWSDNKRKKIIEDYFFVTERKPFEEYNISIFDSIREKVIQNIDDKEIVEKEKSKLQVLTNTNDIIQRFRNQGEQIKKQKNIQKKYISKNK